MQAEGNKQMKRSLIGSADEMNACLQLAPIRDDGRLQAAIPALGFSASMRCRAHERWQLNEEAHSGTR